MVSQLRRLLEVDVTHGCCVARSMACGGIATGYSEIDNEEKVLQSAPTSMRRWRDHYFFARLDGGRNGILFYVGISIVLRDHFLLAPFWVQKIP